MLAMTAPAQTDPVGTTPYTTPMKVGPNHPAVVCEQLVAVILAVKLLHEQKWKDFKTLKSCLAAQPGTPLLAMGSAPNGFVYVIKPTDGMGMWTYEPWLVKEK